MPLTDSRCRNTKPNGKIQKLSDAGGLYLFISPTGQTLWRMNYRYANKQKTLSFGAYPITSLADARMKRDEAKRNLTEGRDPALIRKAEKANILEKSENTFEKIAREWHAKQKKHLSADYWQNKLHRLECDVFPKIGGYPIEDIKPAHLLSVMQAVESRGAHEIARRNLQVCSQIFRYAIVTSRCEHDPTIALKGALIPVKKTHYAAIDANDLPELLQKIERNGNRLFPTTINALLLMLLTFVRTGELIGARLCEFDLHSKIWLIPAERMKMKREHIVPLSRQVLAVLKNQMQYADPNGYLFPSQIRPGSHMSNNTILKALERMGYKGKMTGHGFRSLAMTAIIEKLGYPKEIPDRQLAHAERNKVLAAYDRSQHIEARTRMMQDWADYLDKMRDS